MAETQRYIERLQSALVGGDATEHTHRPALKDYLESFGSDLTATNEPKRVAAGAPDFDVAHRRSHGGLSLGKVEAKDIGSNLVASRTDSERANPRTREGDQLRRYRGAFDNLLVTDYVTFHWYRRGVLQTEASLGSLSGGTITTTPEAQTQVEALIEDFLHAAPQPIRSARMLAERMARLTDLMADVVLASLKTKTASANTVALHTAFKDVLVSDMTDEQFADMFCQTVAYGLFAARVRHDPAAGPFLRTGAASEIPRTNPFLRRLFATITGPELDDEPFVGLIDDLAQLLDDADMERVLRDFGAAGRRDPVVHFYETFLAAYDPTLRDIRGVYYTPPPVVQYITKSIDRLLVTKFGIADGLADTSRIQQAPGGTDDHKVLVLDPATGTSTFLYEVIHLVRDRVKEAGMAGAWPSYVREHLLPRLFGFEIMMAPYAVAHLKLGLQLAGQDLPEDERASFAYDFAADDRVGVYLTNTLDPGETRTSILLGEFISDEANAAAHVKTDKPIMVVLGNPPYQGQSMNSSERVEIDRRGRRRKVRTHIGELIDDYYSVDGVRLDERNPKWLQDDYVKFIRFGQDRIDRTGHGVLAFVTNHTYLDAPTFRGMRASLLRSFDDIYIIDLHGSTRRREKNPNGGADENVFDQIQQGVCIAIFVKTTDSTEPATIHHHERWGTRQEKYDWLGTETVTSTEFQSLTPTGPFFGFHPEDSDLKTEWEAGISVKDIFPVGSTGVVTHRDSLAIDTNEPRLRTRMNEFLDPANTDAALRRKLFGTTSRTTSTGITYEAGDNRDWQMVEKRRSLQGRPEEERAQAYQPIHYRPFDQRTVFYHRDVIDSLKQDVMQHMIDGPNVGLVTARSNKSQTQDQFLVSTAMTEVKTGEATTGSVLFPLWLYGKTTADIDADGDDSAELLTVADVRGDKRVANISKQMTDLLQERLGLTLTNEDFGDLASTASPRDILNYVYAIGYSRTYRIRYADFLRRDYPHIPITSDLDLFKNLCGVGKRLVNLHTFQGLDLSNAPTFPAAGHAEIASNCPVWVPEGETPPDGSAAATEDRLYINKDGATGGTGQYFTGIAEAVWEYQIGGHKVLDKWFKSRRGEALSFDDIQHIRRTVVAIRETIAVQDEIEETITKWPIA